MGTDRLGRDVLSRVMVGSRDVFIVAPLAAGIGVLAGSILGLTMGYYRGSSTMSRAGSWRRSSPFRSCSWHSYAGRAGSSFWSSSSLSGSCSLRSWPGRSARRSSPSASSTTSRPPSSAVSRARSSSPGDLPERAPPDRRGDDGPVRLRDLHDRDAVVPRRRDPAAVRRLGPDGQRGIHLHDLGDLVVDALSCAGHREHRHRHQPRGRCPQTVFNE